MNRLFQNKVKVLLKWEGCSMRQFLDKTTLNLIIRLNHSSLIKNNVKIMSYLEYCKLNVLFVQ